MSYNRIKIGNPYLCRADSYSLELLLLPRRLIFQAIHERRIPKGNFVLVVSPCLWVTPKSSKVFGESFKELPLRMLRNKTLDQLPDGLSFSF